MRYEHSLFLRSFRDWSVLSGELKTYREAYYRQRGCHRSLGNELAADYGCSDTGFVVRIFPRRRRKGNTLSLPCVLYAARRQQCELLGSSHASWCFSSSLSSQCGHFSFILLLFLFHHDHFSSQSTHKSIHPGANGKKASTRLFLDCDSSYLLRTDSSAAT